MGKTALRELSDTVQTCSFDNSSAAADSDHSNANLAVLYEVSRQIYYRTFQEREGRATPMGKSALMLASIIALVCSVCTLPAVGDEGPPIRQVRKQAHWYSYRPCRGYRCGCPDRYSCYPLYGAYGPYGGVPYWSAYSSFGWGLRW